MKKPQVLGLAVALAGNVALMLPETAIAAIDCTFDNTTKITTCSGSGNYMGVTIDFKSSKGVTIKNKDESNAFAACGFHVSGSKAYGMTTKKMGMSIKDKADNLDADVENGCTIGNTSGGGGSGGGDTPGDGSGT